MATIRIEIKGSKGVSVLVSWELHDKELLFIDNRLQCGHANLHS
jgi:hypothetical protein